MSVSEAEDAQKTARLEAMRHSAAHIMAEAVSMLHPDVKLGIGPATADGFYYDFDLSRPLTPEDLESVDAKMREIVGSRYPFQREEIEKAAAREMFASQPYKLELIDELPDDAVTVYRQGTFVDLCRGPHVESTDKVRAFKLLSVAGAYWRGDEHRPMLQRIYGTAFETEAELEEHLRKLEEIEARDHRRLTKQLDLMSFHEEAGAGLAHWHPKGGLIRVLIEDYWRTLHYEGGYDIIFTPHIGRSYLWETSGHLDFYKDSMYSPMDIDGQEYYIKPMNCPFHILIYKTRLRSYRELPLRWAELGTVYRYERSGTLHGLLRVRGFTQDDAHVMCTPEQIEDEILRVLDFSLNMLRGFGFEDFKVELSVRDPVRPEKYAGSDAMWNQAEGSLVEALEARGLSYERIEGEAVFYGPKIDIKIRDALGRSWQCTTIQFDFNLPERFDMSYIGEDGKEHRPYMVHRALLGSLERFFGVLVEHYGGAFPVWLAPVQAVVIPITDGNLDYARRVADELRGEGIRVEIDERSERMNLKIRDAQLQKVPYMLVTGNKEEESSTISVRFRTGENRVQSVPEFKATVKEAVAAREAV
jgi:threonyl-tRNA synthetase